VLHGVSVLEHEVDAENVRSVHAEYIDNGDPAGPADYADAFTYDDASRLAAAASSRYLNTCSRSYDEAGRLNSEGLAIDSDTWHLEYAYDPAGRQTTVRYPGSTAGEVGEVLTRTLDNRGLITGMAFAGNAIVGSMTYDDGGRETARQLANGITENTSYSADYRIRRSSFWNRVARDSIRRRWAGEWPS
jgi:hypothetical protein